MTLDYVLQRWAAIRAGLIEAIGKLRDDELDYRPYAGAWSVRQLVLHIAHEELIEFNHGLSQTLPEFPPEYAPADFPDRAALLALLEAVHTPNAAYLQALTDADLARVIRAPWGSQATVLAMVDHLLEHEIHHRAELSLILGLLGREGLNV